MKFSKFILLILFITTLYSCKKVDYYWKYHQIVVNHSGVPIEISVLHGGNLLYNFNIAAADSLLFYKEYDNDFNPFENSEGLDSISIVFNSEKYLFYTCKYQQGIESGCDVDRNMLNSRYYTETKLGEREYRYRYIITEEDYNNAVPIEK